eukprot:2819172-Rhodomonas_salina.1
MVKVDGKQQVQPSGNQSSHHLLHTRYSSHHLFYTVCESSSSGRGDSETGREAASPAVRKPVGPTLYISSLTRSQSSPTLSCIGVITISIRTKE